jgi:hypothetical protein
MWLCKERDKVATVNHKGKSIAFLLFSGIIFLWLLDNNTVKGA